MKNLENLESQRILKKPRILKSPEFLILKITEALKNLKAKEVLGETEAAEGVKGVKEKEAAKGMEDMEDMAGAGMTPVTAPRGTASARTPSSCAGTLRTGPASRGGPGSPRGGTARRRPEGSPRPDLRPCRR
jgi:hypothetical protein